MQNLVIKIVKALSKIENEKGPFIVKCLVARNPDDIQWDLVLAADWFDEDRIQRLNYLSKKVLCDFDSDTISQFSGIIAISPDSQLAQFLSKIQDESQRYFGKLKLGKQRIIQTDNHQAPMVLSLVNFPSTEAA
jgi:hypothetical protein